MPDRHALSIRTMTSGGFLESGMGDIPTYNTS